MRSVVGALLGCKVGEVDGAVVVGDVVGADVIGDWLGDFVGEKVLVAFPCVWGDVTLILLDGACAGDAEIGTNIGDKVGGGDEILGGGGSVNAYVVNPAVAVASDSSASTAIDAFTSQHSAPVGKS